MNNKQEKIFSMPGVVGMGYGKKITNGQVTDHEALIVFVQKKIPPTELTDEEFIPYSINDTPTDVIEIGEVIAHRAIIDNKAQNRNYDILYRFLLNASQGVFKSPRLTTLQALVETIKLDLEKLLLIKDIVTEINWKGYKEQVISFAALPEILSNMSKDMDRFALLTKLLSDINIGRYRNSLGAIVNDVNANNLLQEAINNLRKFLNFFSNIRRKSISRTTLVRPAQPGVSIGHYNGGTGTFGALVYDISSKEPLILSNNHVLANTSLANDPRSKIGDPIIQPGKIDGATKEIGKLVKYAALNPQPMTNAVDCAIAKPNNPQDISPEILEIGKITGIADPIIGMKVRKSGRTTGLTSGEILAVDATIKVGYGEGLNLTFENQIIATAMSEPGDSGSLVVDSQNKAVGLLFAGSAKTTVINPIEPVLDVLGIKL